VDVLRVHLARASRGGVSGVRVDLTDVTVLASAGVQVLVQLINDGGPVELLAPMGTPAQHVLDLVRLPYRSWPGRPPFGARAAPTGTPR
jgi:ABC-type transporter Mla MlaB component